MAGIYTAFTLADAINDMGSRLYDPQHIRWSESELTVYIQQAIRTYNAFTNHYRTSVEFETEPGQTFYDLGTVAPDERGLSYTVREAVDQLLWHLLEPPLNGTLWTGTEQYSIDDVLSALQQARDTFLMETGAVITSSSQVVPASATGVVSIAEDIVAVRRASWTLPSGTSPLRRDDQWGLVNYGVGWQTPRAARPTSYSVSTQRPLQVQVAPVTSTEGTLGLLTVNRGVAPDLLETDQSLGVPNDWAWVVLFGALAQLFQRDGLAQDAARAAYCDQRWSDGLMRAKAAAVVLAAKVDGSWLPLGSVPDSDAYSPFWQSVPARPRNVLTMGQTLIGLRPPAGVPTGGGNYDVTLDIVRNAPVPVELSDALQIGNEIVNDLLDYAQHLAVLKEGSVQIQESIGLLNQFATMCGTVVQIQTASNPTEMAALGQTQQDERVEVYRS